MALAPGFPTHAATNTSQASAEPLWPPPTVVAAGADAAGVVARQQLLKAVGGLPQRRIRQAQVRPCAAVGRRLAG